jgi:hypothetical protein
VQTLGPEKVCRVVGYSAYVGEVARARRGRSDGSAAQDYLRCAPSNVTAMRQFAEERLCQAWRVPF